MVNCQRWFYGEVQFNVVDYNDATWPSRHHFVLNAEDIMFGGEKMEVHTMVHKIFF